jgi:hypothetical protein
MDEFKEIWRVLSSGIYRHVVHWKSTNISKEHSFHLQDRRSDSGCHLLSRWFLAQLILRLWRWRRYVEDLVLVANYFHARFLLGLFFDSKDGGDIPPTCRMTFTGLQKTILFTITAARTSNSILTRSGSKWSQYKRGTYLYICPKLLRKATKNCIQDSRCPSCHSNRAPPEYKSKWLLLH